MTKPLISLRQLSQLRVYHVFCFCIGFFVLSCHFLTPSIVNLTVSFHAFKYLIIYLIIWLGAKLYGYNFRFNPKSFLIYMVIFLGLVGWDTLRYSNHNNTIINTPLPRDLAHKSHMDINTKLTHNQTIFQPELIAEKPFYAIVGNLVNNSLILPYYFHELERFVSLVGPEQVFISLVEDHSKDSTPEMLELWKVKLSGLGVKHNIRTNYPIPAHSSNYKPAQIFDERKTGLNAQIRIDRLAKLRNAALDPLYSLDKSLLSHPDSKLIFINDILFFMEDIVSLINTSQGITGACAIDIEGIGLYDTWVIRDKNGQFVSSVYPYFKSYEDRTTIMKSQPTEIMTCWNGLLVLSLPTITNLNPPLKFRSQLETEECFSSECFNYIYDLRDILNKQKGTGVFKMVVDPKVMVGYQFRYYLLWKELLNWTIVKMIMFGFFDSLVSFGNSSSHYLIDIFQCV